MSDWLLTFKPSFHHQLALLDGKEVKQLLKKLELLQADPTPDAKVKKQLKHLDGKLHRLRAGPFRIFYTFNRPFVSVLKLDKRDEGTYDDVPLSEDLGGMAPELFVDSDDPDATVLAPLREVAELLVPPASAVVPLARPLTAALLSALRIPTSFHPPLLVLHTEDELLACSEVPPEFLTRVIDAVCGRPLAEILRQPDLMAPTGADDLLRIREQDLASFLLKLTPEQERFVGWAVNAAGPTLLKGGPGTGKSTVALYRVRAMIHALRESGVERPRVLFTTYTNALVSYSRHLLGALLKDDASLVEVQTADKIVRDLAPGDYRFARREDLVAAAAHARKSVRYPGNSLQQRAMARTIERMSDDYLVEELLQVIEARGLDSLEAYLEAPRSGRRIALNQTQRTAVWALREPFGEAVRRAGLTTWTALRQIAARRADRAGAGAAPRYDAVLVDEVQDLDPSVLRLLVGLAASPGRIFLAADANQSIYGSGFRWQDVHASLRFTGRTGVLRNNHRTTAEIGRAAWSFLGGTPSRRVPDPRRDGALDREESEDHYLHSGPVPAARSVASTEHEAQLLARFLPAAAREFRVALGAAAVLVPTKAAGEAVASRLQGLGIAAAYMPSEGLDLARPAVKVLTMKAAKGLEFPVVALAGFLDGTWPPTRGTTEEREEVVAQERRTVFVAMTRAMRALLVVTPAAVHPVLSGFDPTLWNVGEGR